MLHQIKAQQFYTDLDVYQLCLVLQKIAEFKDFSRLLSDFPKLFKADLIFKDLTRKPSKFKYFSSLCEPFILININSLHAGPFFMFLLLSADFFQSYLFQKNISGTL